MNSHCSDITCSHFETEVKLGKPCIYITRRGCKENKKTNERSWQKAEKGEGKIAFSIF